MRLYLDNCCFNRPFDDQSHPRIRVETEAKLLLQAGIQAGTLELIWSYVLDFENRANPFETRRLAVDCWKSRAVIDVTESPALLHQAGVLARVGLAAADALHVACAIAGGADFFVTTDDRILRRNGDIRDVQIIDPTALVRTLYP